MSNISTASYVISEPAASDATRSPATGRHVNGLASSPSIWRRAAPPIAAALVAGAAVGAAVWPTSPPLSPLSPRVTRFALSPAGTQAVQIDSQSTDVMLTADGAMLIYKGGADAGVSQLFLRPLDALEPTPLTAPGAPKAPFASPDGQWIGFFEPGPPVALKKVAITGGPAQLLTSFDGASRGATWGDDGSIIVATTNQATGLYRVSSSGGEPTVLTRPNRERGEYDHLYPQ